MPEHDPTTTTVRQVVEYWREREGHKYEPRSYATKDYYTELFALDFGERLAEKLTVAEVVSWIKSDPNLSVRQAGETKRKNRNRLWSEGTQKNAARTIIHLFHLAEDHGLIERHKLKPLVSSFADAPPRRPVTIDEYQKLIDYGTDQNWRDYVFFLRWSACRPGEANALRWPMIHWSEGYARLLKHKSVKKTRKPRDIPLIDCVLELLCRLEAGAREREGGEPQGHVFVNERGTKWTSQVCTKRMQTIRKRCVEAGQPLAEDVYLHGLRHLAATEMIANGAPLKLVADCLGHQDIATTQESYCDLSLYVKEKRATMANYLGPREAAS